MTFVIGQSYADIVVGSDEKLVCVTACFAFIRKVIFFYILVKIHDMKTPLLYTLLLLLLIIESDKLSAQSFQWAWAFASTGNGVAINAAVPDAAGNVYVTGCFEGTTDFDPSPAEVIITSEGGDGDDIFISKLDASGNLLWVRAFGSQEDGLERGLSLVLDDESNIYVGGMYAGTIDFDPGPGTASLGCSGERDGFVLKLDNDGNFGWVRRIDGSQREQVNNMTSDESGNICIVGNCSGNTSFDTGSGTIDISGSSTTFILKYDLDGTLILLKGFRGAGFDVACDISGNIYTTGYFEGTADFDPSSEAFSLTSAGDDDIFISKLNLNGDFVWAKHMGGVEEDQGVSVATDNDGNILLTGFFRGSASLDPNGNDLTHISNGTTDSFVSKLDASGNLIWVNQIGGTSAEEGRSIDADGLGNVYCSGFFTAEVDFDSSVSETVLTSNGGTDVYFTKLNSDGGLIWAKQIGNASYERTRWIWCNDSGSEVYVGLDFIGTVDMDPDDGVTNISGANYGGGVVKMGPVVNGIDDEAQLLHSLPYPNPTEGKLQFNLPLPSNEIKVIVRNSLGQEVMQKSLFNVSQVELNIEGPSGFYIVELANNFGVKAYRVLKL
jgi:hypothetical protein